MSEFNTTLDLYLDGELPADAVADLLLQCEEQPELWRVCALRCVESIELRRTFRELTESEDTALRTRPSGSRTVLPLIIAAALLCCVSFVAGRWDSTSEVADATSETQQNTAGVSSGRETVKAADQEADQATQPDTTPQSSPDEVQIVGIARMHRLAGQGPPVPVVAGPGLDFETLLRQPPEVPEDVRRRAGNRGMQVQPARQVMALELSDGQRLAIPLDSVGLRYVGHSVL